MQVVHRDVAARNVLVKKYLPGELPIVKISDLGLSRYLLNEDLYRARSHVSCNTKSSLQRIFQYSCHPYRNQEHKIYKG